MLVSIAVIKRQSGSMVRLELRNNLGRQLTPRLAIAHKKTTEGDEIRAERACFIHQIGNRGRRKHRPTLSEHEMQSNTQRRQSLGARNRIGRGGRHHHQTCGSENAFAVRQFNRLIHFGRRAEVVRRDNETFQAPSCRVRKK